MELLQYVADTFFAYVINLITSGVWNVIYPIEEFIGNGTYQTTGEYFQTYANSGGYRTVTKIDLTNYKTITFVGKCNTVDSNHGCDAIVAHTSDVTNTLIKAEYSTSEKTMVLDVSSLTGEYYVGLNNYQTVSYTKSIKIE